VKRGIGVAAAHNCNIFDNHDAVAWWYSWKSKAGFSRGFCHDPKTALDHARDDLGKEFVPMFHPTIPPQPFDEETEDNLQKAKYLLTLNEPEKVNSGNMTAIDAAILWPKIVTIAKNYNLPIVGPCSTSRNGHKWYKEWLSHCTEMYGEPCHFDFTCFHFYYYPYPCGDNIPAWACIGPDVEMLKKTVRRWYNWFGKPLWITEFACLGGMPCGEEGNMEIMKKVTPYLDASDVVFRYAWFSVNREPNNTNEVEWSKIKKSTCLNNSRLENAKSVGDCYRHASQSSKCNRPFFFSYNKKIDDCYCSTDSCEQIVKSHLNILVQNISQDSSKLTPVGEHVYDRTCLKVKC